MSEPVRLRSAGATKSEILDEAAHVAPYGSPGRRARRCGLGKRVARGANVRLLGGRWLYPSDAVVRGSISTEASAVPADNGCGRKAKSRGGRPAQGDGASSTGSRGSLEPRCVNAGSGAIEPHGDKAWAWK